MSNACKAHSCPFTEHLSPPPKDSITPQKVNRYVHPEVPTGTLAQPVGNWGSTGQLVAISAH